MGEKSQHTPDLTYEQIIGAARKTAGAKLPQRRIECAALGGPIWVRGMTGRERDEFEESMRISKGRRRGDVNLRNYRGRFASRVIVNAEGQRMLRDEDAEVLGRLPAAVLDEIISVSQELSGVTDEEVEELGNASESPGASVEPSSSSHLRSA